MTENSTENVIGTRHMINIHAYPSPITHESRMFKETKAIANSGLVDEVVLVGVSEPGLSEWERLNGHRRIWRVRLVTPRLPLRLLWRALAMIEWQVRVFWKFKSAEVVAFSAHNLASVPLGMAFKRRSGCLLVYDTHELESQRHGWPALVRNVASGLERRWIRSCDVVFVVSDSIGQWYRQAYRHEEIHVIKNYPEVYKETEPPPDLKHRFALQRDEVLFIYQGAIGQGRGVELLLEVFARAGRPKHIVFMGFVTDEKLGAMLKQYTERHSNIHYQPAVRPHEVLGYTRSADVGFYVIDDASLSYGLSAGNKVYEYLSAGIPFIANPLPDVASIVREYNCGWLVEPTDDALAELLERLTPEEIGRMKVHASNCRGFFQWETEEDKMLTVYRRFVSSMWAASR